MIGTLESGGAILSYADTGTGAPVVFLHPTPLDGYFWKPVIDRMEGIRCIVPDLRGHGASQLGETLPVGAFARVPDAPAVTMERLAADILEILDQCSVPKAAFVGCSIGGYVLLELWRRQPGRMRGLAFVCSKPQPDAEANLLRRAQTIAQARTGEMAALFDGMAQASIGATARRRSPGIVPALRSRMTLSREAVVAVQAGLAARPDSVPTVRTIDTPVLAIAGGEDSAVAPAEMEAFEAAPGGCRFHLIPDAGHFAGHEQPELVAALLGEWLAEAEDL